MPYSEFWKPMKHIIFYYKDSAKYVWITKLLSKIVLSFISKNRLETLVFAGKINKSWFFLKAADKDSIISYGDNLIFCFIKLCHRMHDWKAKYNILEEAMKLLASRNNCSTLSNSKLIQLEDYPMWRINSILSLETIHSFYLVGHVICTDFIWLSVASAGTINPLNLMLEIIYFFMSTGIESHCTWKAGKWRPHLALCRWSFLFWKSWPYDLLAFVVKYLPSLPLDNMTEVWKELCAKALVNTLTHCNVDKRCFRKHVVSISSVSI